MHFGENRRLVPDTEADISRVNILLASAGRHQFLITGNNVRVGHELSDDLSTAALSGLARLASSRAESGGAEALTSIDDSMTNAHLEDALGLVDAKITHMLTDPA